MKRATLLVLVAFACGGPKREVPVAKPPSGSAAAAPPASGDSTGVMIEPPTPAPPQVTFCDQLLTVATQRVVCSEMQLDGPHKQIDLAPLAAMTDVRELVLIHTEPATVEVIGKLDKLEVLTADHAKLPANGAFLRDHPALRQLGLASSTVTSLAAVGTLRALSHLDVRSTRITDWKPLQQLATLAKLDISDTTFADLRTLANAKELRELVMQGTRATDLRPLAKLAKLTSLRASRSAKLAHFDVLGTLRELDTVVLSGTPVRSLEWARSLANLRELRIDATRVIDLRPLYGLARLRELVVPKGANRAHLKELANRNPQLALLDEKLQPIKF